MTSTWRISISSDVVSLNDSQLYPRLDKLMDSHVTNDLRRLITNQATPCVSIYMPTHVAGENGQQDPVRLKNLLQRAEEQLSASWLRSAEARRFLQAARDLPADPVFWENRSQGLAVFITPETFHRYRLPLQFDEFLMVGRRHHLKPLLTLLNGGDRYFILTLSQKRVRFYVASRHALEQQHVEGLPENMKEALNYTGVERGSQAHSAMQGSLGKQAAVFHGQGGQADTRKEDITTFFRMIDAALQPVLRDETTPLLLTGVEYVLPIYREVTGYPYLVKQELVGNCDYLTRHQLHQRAWPLMEPFLEQTRRDSAERYLQLVGTDKTSDQLEEILPAAHDGRIDTLFVDVQAHRWGRFDSQKQELEVHLTPDGGVDDLLDLAAVETLSHRGTVYAVPAHEVPGGKPVAAMFRY
jgi:hypothetical protein